jgi:hypothetical protein
MSDLWPEWKTGDAPRDGAWFTARRGLSGYITRCRFDPGKAIYGTASSDRVIGTFVDEHGSEVIVSQWWPEGEGQPAVPAMPKPELTRGPGESLLLNGAPISREAYTALFGAVNR